MGGRRRGGAGREQGGRADSRRLTYGYGVPSSVELRRSSQRKRRRVMGDTGQKDKNRKQKQKTNKQNEEAKRKQERQQVRKLP